MVDSWSSRQCPGPGRSPGIGKAQGSIMETTELCPGIEVGDDKARVAFQKDHCLLCGQDQEGKCGNWET